MLNGSKRWGAVPVARSREFPDFFSYDTDLVSAPLG